ncbi:hypothetical protein RM574_25520 [Streptomyces sp. DSM 41982]|uniref:Uncharacterized protein n=1 Tax=Streptomyces evansiae TaxID=3075535 RepID=A0ABD5EBR2_9ACTN|nr:MULTISPECIES: hypothetical protein [unclassified Streptomyces]MDT0418844.1 hypothetical protein [Streptomyces sp. DSM 41982]SCD46180.1 hypothetical protein GA0115246_102024 [Streptomyces sp. SolWspMP-sol7th]
MLPAKPTPAQRTDYTAAIVHMFRAATPDQRWRGRQWYPAAHALADEIASGDAVKGAGVLAALSANKSWSENCRLARKAFLEGKASGHFGDAVTKADCIMSGTHPSEVLPMHLKTGAFFLCIADPDHPDSVVIDRHAHDIAAGKVYGQRDRGLGAIGRYNALADCYRQAAHLLGELPSTVQAVTWIAHIER